MSKTFCTSVSISIFPAQQSTGVVCFEFLNNSKIRKKWEYGRKTWTKHRGIFPTRKYVKLLLPKAESVNYTSKSLITNDQENMFCKEKWNDTFEREIKVLTCKDLCENWEIWEFQEHSFSNNLFLMDFLAFYVSKRLEFQNSIMV